MEQDDIAKDLAQDLSVKLNLEENILSGDTEYKLIWGACRDFNISKPKSIKIFPNEVFNYLTIRMALSIVHTIIEGMHCVLNFTVVYDGYALNLNDFKMHSLAEDLEMYCNKYTFVYEMPHFEFEGF